MATYGEHALSGPSCREKFRRFKRGDFSVEDKDLPGLSKKYENLIGQEQCQKLH